MNTYTVLCNLQTPVGTLWNKNGDTIFQPEEVPSMLKESIEITKGKKSKAEKRYIFINNLRHFGLDIIQTLHVMGYETTDETDTKKMPSKTYAYLIGDNLCFYSITIKYSKRYIVRILDTDNLLSVSDPVDIVKTWSNGELTIKELGKSYQKAISELLTMTSMTKKLPLTISGIARRVYFRDPQKHYDCVNCTTFFKGAEEWFRGSYHGGLNLSSDTGYIREHNDVICLDCNSLYPYVMLYGNYPVGKPWKVSKENLADTIERAKDGRNYFFIHIKAKFEIKEDGVPCVCMSKKDPMRWMYDKQWMKDSRYTKPSGEKGSLRVVDLYLTQTDFFLFLDNYKIYSMDFCECYAFQAKKGLFTDYIGYWYNMKRTLSGGRKRVAKLMLNSLSGSMARRVDYVNGTVYFDERDLAQVKYDRIKQRNPKCYVHIGAAITSYARAEMVKRIRANYDRWLYTDTDSLHLKGYDIPGNIRISDNIGDFKVEKKMDTVVYYKLKEYVYHDAEGYHLTLAGVEKRDTEDIERYLDKRTGTRDLWIGGKYSKEWKALFKSKDPLMDMYELQIPVSYKARKDWFNTKVVPSWHSFYDKDAIIVKKNIVTVTVKHTDIQQLREHDAKADAWYKKKHANDKVLPVDEWLKVVNKREKADKADRDRQFDQKKQDYYIRTHQWDKVKDDWKDAGPTPFDNINNELGSVVFN